MRSENRFIVAMPLVLPVFALVSACAVQTSGRPVAVSEPREQIVTDTETAPVTASEEAAESTQLAEESSIEDIDPIQAILENRRRGDYPELELQEYGFTITENVRVGGDAQNEYDRALILLRQQRYAEGIALLEGVTETVPDATVPYIDLGIAYRLSGDNEQAERSLNIAAALSPENPVVHNELGIVYRETGRFAEARASYERALSVFGDFHYARKNLGVLCDLYLGDLECALTNYTSYLDSMGSDPEVEIWIADLEIRLASSGGI